ncbi:MAG: zf-HC2 domain-containing protein [Deltaproteobacteria bacterium]|nr:zf-HC2 domain-containing protein [Deltaproteobacteria bacterium]
MAHDRDVAGIRCLEVLERLSAYLDHELCPEDVARIEAHLAGCDWCAKFGARFQGVVRELKRALSAAEPVDQEAVRRLRSRLKSELG